MLNTITGRSAADSTRSAASDSLIRTCTRRGPRRRRVDAVDEPAQHGEVRRLEALGADAHPEAARHPEAEAGERGGEVARGEGHRDREHPQRPPAPGQRRGEDREQRQRRAEDEQRGLDREDERREHEPPDECGRQRHAALPRPRSAR